MKPCLLALLGVVLSSSLAWAGPYAGSRLFIDNLNLIVTEDGVNPSSNATLENFSFTLTNTATLNGVDAIDTAACSGDPGAPAAGTNNCNPRPNTGLNTPGTRLDADAVNAPASLPIRTNNDFSFFGPSGNEFSNSDSVIFNTIATGDGFAASSQIAESELVGVQSAAANAEIKAVQAYMFTFAVTAPNQQLLLTFQADPNMLAAIDTNDGFDGTALANMNTSFSLARDGSPAIQANWNPDGTPGFNDCIALGGLMCAELFDSEDLNLNVEAATNSTFDPHSDNRFAGSPDLGLQPYGILVSNLGPGDWSVSFNVLTSTSITNRAVRVPEPEMVLTLGVGLLMLGWRSGVFRQLLQLFKK